MAMNEKPITIDVNKENISQYPPTCFLNLKNVGYQIKAEWLKEGYIRMLFLLKTLASRKIRVLAAI